MATVLTDKAIERIAEAVTKRQDAALLGQFQQFAVAQYELSKAKEELARKDAEIADLRSRIAQLSGLLTYTPVVAPPISTTVPVPTWDQRYAVQSPASQQLAPPAAVWSPTDGQYAPTQTPPASS